MQDGRFGRPSSLKPRACHAPRQTHFRRRLPERAAYVAKGDLDREIDAAYKAAMAARDGRASKQLRQAQRDFIAGRDTSFGDPQYNLKREMEMRLAALRELREAFALGKAFALATSRPAVRIFSGRLAAVFPNQPRGFFAPTARQWRYWAVGCGHRARDCRRRAETRRLRGTRVVA
jgi:Lysozyme inhibitor LprI